MSLTLEVTKKEIGTISINYEELKKELELSLAKYKGVLVTEETLPIAKKDKALLNKVAKTINDRKIELKKEFLAPYENVELQAKELIKMINDVALEIDVQIKTFEEKDKTEKMAKITKMWEKVMEEEQLPFLKLEYCFDEKWLNKTFALTNIDNEIKDFISQTKKELSILNNMFDGDDLIAAKTKYYQSVDLYSTLEEMKLEKEIKNQVINEQEKEKVNEQEVVEEKEQFYTLQFEIVATEKKINALSKFLKENEIAYKRIDKEN